MAYDVRGVANFVLQQADRLGLQVTNLAINKIVYFLHASFLQKYNLPLTSAKIEAWDHGPVFRELYHQFKRFGRSPIQGRAQAITPVTGNYEEVQCCFAVDELSFLTGLVEQLLKIPAGKLVDMSHVEDGPWFRARYGEGQVNPGVRISDDLILQHARQQARH